MLYRQYVVLCQMRTVPSSEPEMMTGSFGWKYEHDTLSVCPSKTCTHDLVW